MLKQGVEWDTFAFQKLYVELVRYLHDILHNYVEHGVLEVVNNRTVPKYHVEVFVYVLKASGSVQSESFLGLILHSLDQQCLFSMLPPVCNVYQGS